MLQGKLHVYILEVMLFDRNNMDFKSICTTPLAPEPVFWARKLSIKLLKHYANILEGRCRKGSNGGDSTLLSSKEVTMATEPQSTSQG